MRLFFSVLFLLMNFQGYSQIIAPDLYCVKGDTLRWSLPGNTCGAENGYLIYVASDRNGPYTLLTTITNLAQTEYVHTNSPGGSLYYYMTTDAACPAEITLHSDTLDNNSPNPVTIRYASVSGSTINLAWTRSTSPEVVAYILFRKDPDGTIIRLDTIPGLTYTDTGVDPQKYSYGYYVTAVDQCWVSSTFNFEHRTNLLAGSIDTCKGTMRLVFSGYQGYDSLNYDLWTGINGAPAVRDTNLAFEPYLKYDVLPGVNYSFRIAAINRANGDTAWSNVISMQMKAATVLRSICLTSIDTAGRITFQTNDGLDPGNLQYISGDSLDLVKKASGGVPATVSQGSFLLNESPEDHFIKVIATNSCGDVITSNIIQGLYLNGTLLNAGTIHLSWNPVTWDNSNTKQYRLYVRRSTGWDEVYRTDSGPLEFDYNIPGNSPGETGYCFRAEADLSNPCGSNNPDVITSSNIVCVEKTAGFFMPNAFKRGGVTPVFKPVIYFPENMRSFEMYIYDRWGNQLFHTTDANVGWTGRKGNQDAPVGSYVYFARLVSGNGKVSEQKGTLFLLE